jgi:hypothetical protein
VTATNRLLRSHRRTAVSALAIAGATTLVLSVAAPVNAKTIVRPTAPTSLHAFSNSSGLSLTWHRKNKNVTGYLVEQALNPQFTVGLVKYRTRGIQKVFTPSRVTNGATYFYRVAAVNETKKSHFTHNVVATDHVNFSDIRAMTYNVRSASLDAYPDKGGPSAPFAQRRAGILSLIKQGNADVVGIEEAASCLTHPHGQPCGRQIDSLMAGLTPTYTLDDTTNGRCYGQPGSTCRYAADDIVYKSAVVTPVGTGGHFQIGPSSPVKSGRYAAYQIFRVNATRTMFLYVVTHTLASGGSAGDRIRGAETSSMLKQGRAYAANHHVTNVLFVGDFNSYVGEYHVNDVSGTVMRNANFPDSVSEAAHYSNAKYDSINAFYRRAKHGHGSSDHIYASRGIGVLKWGELLHLSGGKFVGVIPSDHNPVYADVELPTP